MSRLTILIGTCLSLCLAIGTLALPTSASAQHVANCEKKDGVDKARCERHEKMFEKCGAIKGPAHHQCDRDFLLANPLDCAKLSAADKKAAAACSAENRAFKTCESHQGNAFIQCVKKESGESPMGH